MQNTGLDKSQVGIKISGRNNKTTSDVHFNGRDFRTVLQSEEFPYLLLFPFPLIFIDTTCSKSLQIVTAAMKLKDTCSLGEKL